MAEKVVPGTDIPEVEVAVAVIQLADRILAVYNPQWRCFTLPMTKRRKWVDPNPEVKSKTREEDWLVAATHSSIQDFCKNFL